MDTKRAVSETTERMLCGSNLGCRCYRCRAYDIQHSTVYHVPGTFNSQLRTKLGNNVVPTTDYHNHILLLTQFTYQMLITVQSKFSEDDIMN